MSCKNFRLGDRVRFRGTAGENGELLSAHSEGPDTFKAIVHNVIAGVCYGLRYDNGSPVGLPFFDSNLELVKS